MLVPAFLALAVTLALAPVVLQLLRRGDVLDHPSARSSHDVPVVRGGGVAPAVGALVALMAASSMPSWQERAVAATAVMFGAIGLAEDLAGIRALHRLAVHFLAAALAAGLLLHNLTGSVVWQGVLVAGVVFFLVAYVNAFNFMDGINGISVAQAAGAGITWWAVGRHTGTPVLAAGGAIAAAAALGFAPYNFPNARMFLGDAGSYFLGAWLATVAVLGLRAGVTPEAVLAPLVLYAADTGTTLARRVARGERWYLPHRDHAYQRLGDAGWSHVRTSVFVGACIALCGVLGAVSLTGSVPARIVGDLAIAGVIGGYLLGPRWLAPRKSSVVVA